MSLESNPQKIEKKEVAEDNARKFTVGSIDQAYLDAQNPTSFTLIVDWLETGEDNEKKLAYKKFDNGEVQILLISKITVGGNRTSEKKKITESEYRQMLGLSILRIEKKRYEFMLKQNDTEYTIKYDVFSTGPLRLIEVDAKTDEERKKFDPVGFPFRLNEVTGNMKYYGYRIQSLL